MRGIAGFYSAKEAQQVLHVTPDQLQYLVKTGGLRRVVLPEWRYGLYCQRRDKKAHPGLW